MLSAKDFEGRSGSKGSAARIPCESPIGGVRGLGRVKQSSYYPRGSMLLVEGQRARGVYVLCEGRAKISIASADGRTLVLRVAEAGDLLGVGSVLSGRPSEVTIETLERCRLDFVSREDLLKLLDHDKQACLGVARALSNKLSAVMAHARLLLVSKSAAEKLARLLVKWCDEDGTRTAQGIRINSPFTHEEIGQMICASRETVTRLLGDFRRKHILSFENNSIMVRNRKTLESITCP